MHDWLSSIAELIIKNETKIPVIFHVHSTECSGTDGPVQRVFRILKGQQPIKQWNNYSESFNAG